VLPLLLCSYTADTVLGPAHDELAVAAADDDTVVVVDTEDPELEPEPGEDRM
jgi:hypothetical protein